MSGRRTFRAAGRCVENPFRRCVENPFRRCVENPFSTQRRGFSLAELIIVMIILALVSGIAVPRLANVKRRGRLEVVARRIAADIRLTRSQAIREKADRRVVYTVATQSYTLPERIDMDRSQGVYTVKFGKYPTQSIRLVSANFNSSTTLVFNHLGVPSAGGTVTITDGRSNAVLTVNSATGRVTRAIGPAS